MKHPLLGIYRKARHGSFSAFPASLTCSAFFLSLFAPFAWAADGALEALELRYHAEKAIAGERSSELAQAMRESLPGLLQEYLATRDGSIALDTVDDAFVQEQFKTARAMEEPGVALALDVFSGPGTGYEHGLRTSIARLADFNERRAGRVSEAALDAHERVMERQLEKLEQYLALEAKLANSDDRFEAESERTTEEKVDAVVIKLENKVGAVVEKTEAKIETILEQTERKLENNPEKAETIVEKAENKIQSVVESAENKIGLIVTQAENRLASLETTSSTSETETKGEGKAKGKK